MFIRGHCRDPGRKEEDGAGEGLDSAAVILGSWRGPRRRAEMGQEGQAVTLLTRPSVVGCHLL